MLHTLWSPSDAGKQSRLRVFICAQTGKDFEHELRLGDTVPVKSPFTGAATGYPAELCYWTADGTVQPRATPVLLNRYKGLAEPTFCPECGRRVVAHNPAPNDGGKAPPTARQWAMHQSVNSQGHRQER